MSETTWARVHNCFKRNVSRALYTNKIRITTDVPLISFTFDDFPSSAFCNGGAILRSYGVLGTYYVALGLMGQVGPSGPLFNFDELTALVEQGHELGSHTFGHCDSWGTAASDFEQSVLENNATLRKLLPGCEFTSLSYPLAEPQPEIKRRVAKLFRCCRGGGQKMNHGIADLNQLNAYFLEKSRDRIQEVKALIDKTRENRGWLILTTHDVDPHPGPYGCTSEFFDEVVEYAVRSTAQVLPVTQALEKIMRRDPA